MGADDDDLRDAARGEAFARLLPSRQDRDVFVLGAVALPLSQTALLARALEPGRLIGAGAVRFRVIGTPATIADVSDLAFDESEYRSLRDCRPGRCKFKLSLDAMNELAAIDWKAPSAKAQADGRLRERVLHLVADYRARGDAALPHYDDTRGTPAAEALADLLAQSSDIFGATPELTRYLAATPSSRPAHASDLLYWSEDRLPRLRPTLTLNHVVVFTPPSAPAVVVRKMLYANHYFEGAVEFMSLVPGATDSTSWLIVVRRVRFDNLPRSLFNIRGRVTKRLVELTRADLERERRAAAAGRP
jgi:hypothetical protein